VSAKTTDTAVAGLDLTAGKATADLSTRVRGLEKTIDKSIANKYVKNREKTILDALKNPDDVTDLQSLMRSMDKLGETDSLMANMGDVIVKKLSQGGQQAGLAKATGKSAPLSAKAIEDFQVMADSLSEAGVDPKVMKDVWQSLNKLATKTQRTNARKVIFGSDRTAGKFLDSVAGAAALKILPGSSLIMGGAVRKIFAKIGGSGDRRVLAAIDDFMLNPDQYIMAAENAKNPTEAAIRIGRAIVAASQTMAMD